MTAGDAWSVRKRSSTTSLPLDLLFNTGTPSTTINTRAKLIKLLGPDSIPHTMEIDSIPCAGIKIGPGSLEGLIAWRLVVRLDTGRGVSTVSQEVLRALDYAGSTHPGQAVKLVIQGVETRCIVAEKGEASRVSTPFMISGSLSYYFDTRLNAPILHVESDILRPHPLNIPRTVQPNIYHKVLTVLGKIAARSRGD
ncbi:hypothetical protein BD779DRAFT_1675080 [Infundibulicybe gibba]|nr:hypothetical protein BD779DRAFT_1675080 [Infundibulicybe gibba]